MLLCLCFMACRPAAVPATGPVVYTARFDRPGLSDWRIEKSDGSVEVRDGAMEIDVGAGCTVWLARRLAAPVRIDFDVTVVQAGGPNDRCSDLNCFWMAIDPNHPDDLFADSGRRTGAFEEYHGFRLYYVGMGGNANTTTRFRRYTGTGERPLLPGHDLQAPEDLLTPNRRVHIRIVSTGTGIRYLRDGECLFDVADEAPYLGGWFGFRTVQNHLRIHRFEVTSLGGDGLGS